MFLFFILMTISLSPDSPHEKDLLTPFSLLSSGYRFIIAGSETSATLLSASVFYLCKNPAAMKQLVEEIRTAFTADNEITFKNSNLPYLGLVIEESLRLHPPAAIGLPRVVLEEIQLMAIRFLKM
jgi:cytochrome P450